MRFHKQGSITVYFCLMLLVMIPLISTCIFSAKVEAGRFQAANAADQAMFSLFSHYDRSLLQKYDLLFIDGSCQSSELSLSSCLDEFNAADDPLLSMSVPLASNLLTLRRTSSSITDCTLATDCSGAAFEAQAIAAIKDTIGIDAVHQLLSDAQDDDDAEPSDEEPSQDSYDEVEVPEDFVNPLPIIDNIKNQSLLSLVIDDPSSVSDHTTDLSALCSQRSKTEGFGMINTTGHVSGAADRILYDEYLLSHFSNFLHPSQTSLLQYQMEYLLSGTSSDTENLKKIIHSLLLRREAVNLLFLQQNAEKHAELEDTALVIASFLMNPELTPIIQLSLAAGWAFLESVEDIHSLFSGNKIARFKTAASWQVELADIPRFLTDRDALEKSDASGRSYQDYLRIMLFTKNCGQLTGRAMDMVEAQLRGDGNTDFCMDHCIDSLTIETEVLSEGSIPLTISKSFSYRS